MIIDKIIDSLKDEEKELLPIISSKENIFLKVQNVADYLFLNLGEKGENKDYDDFYSVIPNWNSFYITFKMPNDVGFSENPDIKIQREDFVRIKKGSEIFCLCSFEKKEKYFIGKTFLFSNNTDFYHSEKFNLLGISDILINIDGTINNVEYRIKKGISEKFRAYFLMTNDVLFTSMKFINCKNIIKKSNNIDDKIIKRRNREKKFPVTKYYTLEIDGKTKERVEGKNRGLWSNSLHICRGHFKNYTQEAPLFGHYVGTVWCPMHLKGHEEIGIIKKDYVVKI
jgi:hypothetical protein